MNRRYFSTTLVHRLPEVAALTLLTSLLGIEPTLAQTTQPLQFLDLTADAPASWRVEPPGSRMRVVEMAVPGNEPGRLLVYYFGRGQGGSPEANVARWRGQFSGPDGGPVEPRIERFEAAGMPVTLARFEGNYARGIGAGAGAPQRHDQILLAAVAERHAGNVIIQLFGPATTIRDNEHAFGQFLRSLR